MIILVGASASGKSVVVIKNGILDQKAMKKVRLTVLDLIELLRGQNVFDIGTVQYAVLEVNGNLSVLLNSGDRTATNRDLDIKPKKDGMQIPIISDGKLLNESLEILKIDNKILAQKLKSNRVEDVFLMTMDRYQNYNLVLKDEQK